MRSFRCALVLGVLCSGCDQTSSDSYVSERSPDGYQVRLWGALHSRPQRAFVSNVVKVELLSSEGLKPFEIFRGDRRDAAFRQDFPTEAWVHPKVLLFPTTNARGMAQRPIYLTNESGATAHVVRIACRDLLLLFDIAHSENLEVRCPVTDWISVSGQFADGRTFSERGFRIPATQEAARLRVTDDGVDLHKP